MYVKPSRGGQYRPSLHKIILGVILHFVVLVTGFLWSFYFCISKVVNYTENTFKQILIVFGEKFNQPSPQCGDQRANNKNKN